MAVITSSDILGYYTRLSKIVKKFLLSPYLIILGMRGMAVITSFDILGYYTRLSKIVKKFLLSPYLINLLNDVNHDAKNTQ